MKNAATTSRSDEDEKGCHPTPDDDMVIEGFTAEGSSSSSTEDDAQSRKLDDEERQSRKRDADATSIAGRVMSRITTRSSVAPSPPPDGGFTAWMVGKSCLP